MNNLSLYLLFNISLTSFASLIFIYFILKILLVKNKDVYHWIFFAVCFLSLLRIISFYFIVIPILKQSEFFGMLLYRIQTVTFFFLPTLLTHMFYSLPYKKNKKYLLVIVLFFYALSLSYYIFALTGIYPTSSEIKVDNDKIFFINNTSSLIYKSVIIFFVFSYIFSIYLLSKYSKIKMTNKDRKILNIIKWSYILVFGYGYIVQFFISLIRPRFFSLAPYLLIYLSIVIYYTTTRYNFLKIYKTSQFLNIVNEDFTIPFIITDEKGVIIKSNSNNLDNNFFYGKSVFSVFPESQLEISSILEEGKILKNLSLKLDNTINQIEATYTADINPIKDKFSDIIGLFIILSEYKISEDSFSNREQEIINYLIKGASYKEIAFELNISYNTVNTHIKNIYKKSGVGERKELLNSLSHIN